MTVETVTGVTTWVGDALERLALCLCAQIVADGSPSTCFCGVMPGQGVAADLASCGDGDGIGFVRLASTYPAQTVGVADQTPGNCGVAIGLDIEVGIYRCFPFTGDGSFPDPETLLEVSRQQYLDMESMRRALICCDWLPAKDVLLGQYNPLGPDGDLIGGTWQVFAQIFGPA